MLNQNVGLCERDTGVRKPECQISTDQLTIGCLTFQGSLGDAHLNSER